MKVLLFISFLFTVSAFAQGEMTQNTTEKFPLKAERFVGKDNFGHLYYIKNQTLIKQSGAETFEFKDFQMRTIISIENSV